MPSTSPTPSTGTFTGVVLAGGRSSRMGRDKALVELGGRPLALIAADALRAAGANRVVVVGGDGDGLGALGLEVHPDDHPGEGPLGAIVTALGLDSSTDRPLDPTGIVMVLACDMPTIDADTVAAVVGTLAAHPDADGAVPVLDGRRQILTAAYRRRLRPHLAAAFAAGERAPRRALEGVEIVEVDGLDPDRLADVDRPADLHRYAHPHTSTGPAGAAPPERGSP
jgi:molybdenum cofactor guanylyltransferase